MNHESDRRAFMIYLGAILLVGLVIVFGATLSWNSTSRSDQSTQFSREANPS
ncbi:MULTISPECIES: hypothetical protein [Rhizobium]|uniref:hypothetical protein n=1 Tax=Rhizobium TaxID=379 RepID=UPI0007F143D1|nr:MULTISPECIES: hypothetical protein [Rhizobium]ANK88680.1 hypothetical protein AMK02_PD00061 [Rhizobium sp. N731]ANK94941.1 hypothetical protein AMK01_PD00059 [Rhizobium sp. N6212]ANL00993.1 hypothetical protein AMK00_PD00059 [Rhizobium sp. N621]ANL07114.1 hypothetical protein AMJ99_PD00059 [Rhizobium esperanzae]ANL13284.1 hypothetical protein AMJ98_PE00059 [Rhizobium sp. N1341]